MWRKRCNKAYKATHWNEDENTKYTFIALWSHLGYLFWSEANIIIEHLFYIYLYMCTEEILLWSSSLSDWLTDWSFEMVAVKWCVRDSPMRFDSMRWLMWFAISWIGCAGCSHICFFQWMFHLLLLVYRERLLAPPFLIDLMN